MFQWTGWSSCFNGLGGLSASMDWMVFGFSMVFVVWAASEGWMGSSVYRVANVQCYMVCVV